MFNLRMAIEDMNALGKEFIYKGICYEIKGDEIAAHTTDELYYTLTEAEILEGTTIIPQNAFTWCDRLIRVTIPNGVTSIGENAFYACVNLRSVTIPESVVEIGALAFDIWGYNTLAFTGQFHPLTFKVRKDSYAHKWCTDQNEVEESLCFI